MGSIFDRPEVDCSQATMTVKLADGTSTKAVAIGDAVKTMRDVHSAAAIMATRGGDSVELTRQVKSENKDVTFKAKGSFAPGRVVSLQALVDAGIEEITAQLYLEDVKKEHDAAIQAAFDKAMAELKAIADSKPRTPAPETPPAPTGKRQKRKARQAERAAQSEAPAPEENGQPVEETASA